MEKREIKVGNGWSLGILVILIVGGYLYYNWLTQEPEKPKEIIEEISSNIPPDTANPKPKEKPVVLSYGIITDMPDGIYFSGPVTLFSSEFDPRVKTGQVRPGDTVAIMKKGSTYWRVMDKHDSANGGYLMAGWVKEITTNSKKK